MSNITPDVIAILNRIAWQDELRARAYVENKAKARALAKNMPYVPTNTKFDHTQEEALESLACEIWNRRHVPGANRWDGIPLSWAQLVAWSKALLNK